MIIGYAITGAVVISFVSLLITLYFAKKDLKELLIQQVNLQSIIALALIVAFFIVFSLLYVHPTEQLYFDENIYQGIALNVLQHGNALWCQYGSAQVKQCFENAVYHDSVGWTIFIAIAFSLFGVGSGTAFGLQLLVGALSVIAVFLLASSLSRKKEFAVISALIFALIPELFIWSRTQADLDLSFMMFSTMTFFFFAMFMKRQNFRLLSVFCFSLLITVYLRLEAILLVPIFIILYIFYDENGVGVRRTLSIRYRLARRAIDNSIRMLVLLMLFVFLIAPEVFYIALQASSPNYGQSASNKQLFSMANFYNNSVENAKFLGGYYNQLSYYPAMFPQITTFVAIFGIAIAILGLNRKRNVHMLILLLLWFVTYFMFYGLFYAGGATFGVDVRFMLQLMPAISILAAVGIVEFGDFIVYMMPFRHHDRFARRRIGMVRYSAYAIMLLLLIAYPFYSMQGLFTIPVSKMPQQSVISPAVSFIDSNYNAVPSSCMVFTFTPDVWYELNRSAAQISYINSNNQTFVSDVRSYSCFVFDYGYWCTVPPYHSGFCSYIMTNYKLEPLAREPSNAQGNFTLYRLLNYTP